MFLTAQKIGDLANEKKSFIVSVIKNGGQDDPFLIACFFFLRESLKKLGQVFQTAARKSEDICKPRAAVRKMHLSEAGGRIGVIRTQRQRNVA